MNHPKANNRHILLGAMLLCAIIFSVVTIAMATAPDPGHNFTEIGGGVAQGNILYGSAADTLSALAKDANATRYLSNTGTSNNPAWAQVNLANGVTGTLADGSIASALTGKTYNGLTPTAQAVGFTIAGGTTSKTLTITGDATISGNPLSNPMTTAGDIIYGGSSGTPTRLANGTAGQLLQSNGTTLAPTWVTSGASGANTSLSNLSSPAINANLVGAVTGGMTISGGSAANDDLILQGTTNATRTTSYLNLQPNGGFVGISTSTPDTNLQVVGNAKVSSTYFPSLFLESTAASSRDSGLTYKGAGGTNLWTLQNDITEANIQNFGIEDVVNSAWRFVIGPTGNIGIGTGTTTPSYKLEVNGSINAITGFLVNGVATARKILVGDGTNMVLSTETYATPGTSGNVLTSDGTNWTSAAPSTGTGSLIGIQKLTTGTTTYIPTAGTNSILIRMVGGGGGGGGATGNTGALSVGGGGGAGSYAEKRFTGIAGAGSYTVAIGSSGTAGVAANGTGGTGGDTTFACPASCTGGALTVTAPGGLGGSTSALATTIGMSFGGAGGAISTNGDFNAPGQPGGYAVRFTATSGVSGAGAPSHFGGGGNSVTNSDGNSAGGNTGSGGSGGINVGLTTHVGGAGSPGIMIIWEFK